MKSAARRQCLGRGVSRKEGTVPLWGAAGQDVIVSAVMVAKQLQPQDERPHRRMDQSYQG
jgi:hypothetical protein